MTLSASQLMALNTDINANTATIGGTQIKDLPHTADNAFAVKDWYNQTASPDYFVWRNLPMETVLNLVTFASMTPVDAVPTTPQLTVTVYQARAQACQCKQINFQNLTLGRTTAPMKRLGYRAGLQDCLTNIPAGAGGALIAANWVGVRDAAKFMATRGEKLFATGNGAQATPSDLAVEGDITEADIKTIWGI
jgi:hypothetical protein